MFIFGMFVKTRIISDDELFRLFYEELRDLLVLQRVCSIRKLLSQNRTEKIFCWIPLLDYSHDLEFFKEGIQQLTT